MLTSHSRDGAWTPSSRPSYEMPQHHPHRLYVDVDEPCYYDTP